MAGRKAVFSSSQGLRNGHESSAEAPLNAAILLRLWAIRCELDLIIPLYPFLEPRGPREKVNFQEEELNPTNNCRKSQALSLMVFFAWIGLPRLAEGWNDRRLAPYRMAGR